MPKLVEFEGRQHEFPDDFTDAEISDALSSTSKAQAATLPGRIADSAKASFYQTTQGLAGVAMLGGADFADTIAEYERDMPPVSEEMSRFQKAKGWGEAIKEVFNDWETLPSLIAGGFTGSYPSIAGGAAGAALANPITAAAGVGLGSLATEAGNEFLQVFREEGVNLKDAGAIRKAFADPELVGKAKTKALQRGIPVAAFDAASAGLAGKLLGPAIKKGSGILRATAGEAGVQAGFGGLGEVSASVASGEKIEPAAVIAEVVSELGSGSAEVASVTARRVADQARSVGLEKTAQVVEGPITGVQEAIQNQEKDQVTVGTPENPPTPEPVATIEEQIRLTKDEKSTKGATLITPGSPVPKFDARGLKVKMTPHGMVIYNPKKVSDSQVSAASSGEVFQGEILGMSGTAQPSTEGGVVVSTDTEVAKNVINEVVPNTPEAIQAATDAQQQAAPGGTTTVKTAEQVISERGGEQTNEVQKEGQEVLPDQPVEPNQGEIVQPIESQQRAESQGFIGGTYNVSSNDATEAWASGEVDKFGDNLTEALRVSNRTQMSDTQRNLVQSEILTRATRAYATDPTNLPAFELVQTIPALLRQAGTEQGQALQSRKRVNDKIAPYAAVISYVNRLRIGAVAKLPSRVRRIAQSFNRDDFERVAGLAAEEASKPTTIVDC